MRLRKPWRVEEKVTQEELALPFWLFKYCNGDVTKYRLFKEVLPATVYEMSKLRNNGTKLDQRNINSLLSY